MITRRRMLAGGAGASALLLSGCDRLNGNEAFRGILQSTEKLTMRAQRLVTDRNALAREFAESDMSPIFRSTGTSRPDTPAYQQHLATRFADWRLTVDGLVARPLSLTLPQLRALPMRTQITRHDCVEGWSAIGQWTGVTLRDLLHRVATRPPRSIAL